MNFKDGQQLDFLLPEFVRDVATPPNAGAGRKFCIWV